MAKERERWQKIEEEFRTTPKERRKKGRKSNERKGKMVIQSGVPLRRPNPKIEGIERRKSMSPFLLLGLIDQH